MTSNKDNPKNHPIYVVDANMGSSFFYNDLCFQESELKEGEGRKNVKDQKLLEAEHKSEHKDLDSKSLNEEEKWWHMDFDGAVSKEAAGVGNWVRSPENDPKLLSYKLYFNCTNNEVEYEALILSLKMLKVLKAKKVYGDSQLIINQVNGTYQAKNPRMRSYRNLVLDLLESFKEYHISVIPKYQNVSVDALAVFVSLFKIPIYPNKKYEIEVKNRPTIPDSVGYWKVFDDDKKINRFMKMYDEFENIQIDEEIKFEEVETLALLFESENFQNFIEGKQILQLENKKNSKGLVLLEELFDNNDVAKNHKVTPNEAEVEDCNIGTEKDPKIIKFSKSLSLEIEKVISN